MTGKIVVATDGSDTAQRAIDFAASLSAKFDKPLCIVHVHMFGRPTKEFAKMAEVEGFVAPAAQEQGDGSTANPVSLGGLFPSAEKEIGIAQLITALGEHIAETAKQRAEDAGALNVTTRICVGDFADEILDAAKSENAEMIVMGRRGLGRVREVLLGSVSQKVLHHADCTVIIVN